MTRVQADRIRTIVTAMIWLGAMECLILWNRTGPFLMSIHGALLIGASGFLVFGYWDIRARRRAGRVYAANLMICPSCEYDIRHSAIAVCSKCNASNQVAEGEVAHACRQCAEVIEIPKEFKCPECGAAYRPQEVRDGWKKWLKVGRFVPPRSRVG